MPATSALQLVVLYFVMKQTDTGGQLPTHVAHFLMGITILKTTKLVSPLLRNKPLATRAEPVRNTVGRWVKSRHPTSAETRMWGRRLAAMLALYTGKCVAPEVNLRECISCMPLQSLNRAEPTLDLKPRRDVTRSPKQRYKWPHKFNKKRKRRNIVGNNNIYYSDTSILISEVKFIILIRVIFVIIFCLLVAWQRRDVLISFKLYTNAMWRKTTVSSQDYTCDFNNVL